MNHSVGSPITGGNDHTKTMGGSEGGPSLASLFGSTESKTGGRRRRSGKKSKKGKKSRGGKKRGRKSRKSRKR